jgi:hypothetical protein
VKIGIDFDNTVVSYDGVFHRAAVEQGLIPEALATHKDSVRDYLRRAGREDEWTLLQGYVYGLRMDLARPYPGIREFLARAAECGAQTVLISHKTRHPYRGPAHDLHAAARGFLAEQAIVGDAPGALSWDRVIFEETLIGKLRAIASTCCTQFVDDLPEFLGHPDFPEGVGRVLFDPHGHYRDETRFQRATSWAEVAALVLSRPNDGR